MARQELVGYLPPRQISLDSAREDRLVAEAAMDHIRIRAQYGPGAIADL